MIRTLLIDDEPLAINLVKEYLADKSEFEIIGECCDGFQALKAIQALQPDLLFLDIQMPKISGFELLELLDKAPPVIFTTAFDEYALKAFEANAIDYLLKPFSKNRFDQALTKYLVTGPELTEKKTNDLLNHIHHNDGEIGRIVVKTGSKIRIIPLQEAYYLEADDDYVNIHTQKGIFLKNKTLQFFENNLSPSQFVRIHRSYIVQIAQITRIEPFEKEKHIVILKDGTQLPVSKGGYPKLKAALGI